MNMDEEASNLSTFDIYSDLLLEQQTPGVHVSVDQLEKANVENEAKVKQLEEQLQSVQLKCKTLEEENVILKRNISELFKTAQAELRRKDRQMEELENRRPRYQQKRNDFKSSINDRLRNMRNNSKGNLNRNLSGGDHEIDIDNRGPGVQRGTDSRNIPAGIQQVNRSGQNERPDKTSAETLLVRSDQLRNGERITSHSDKYSEEQPFVKADDMRKYCNDGQSRAGESRGRQRDNNLPVRNSRRETSRRSPNKTKDCRERTQHETLPRQRSPEHRPLSVCSSSKHSKDFVGDNKRHSQSHSPHRSKSKERSKSRGRSRGSDRSSKRSDSRERKPELMKADNERQKKKVKEQKEKRKESHSTDKSDGFWTRRKRKHSSGRKQELKSSHRSSLAAPHKKLRGHDKDKLAEASDGKRFQYNHAEGNKVNGEPPISEDLRSRQTSHTVSNRSSKDSVCDDQHRMRHKSDRKNKSLKRAKDTLHRKHSTPKKHRREKRSKRLASTSKASRSKENTKELVIAGDEDLDNQDSSDTEWVPKESVEYDDPQWRKNLKAVMGEKDALQDDLGIPEEHPAPHAACIASHDVPINHDLELDEEVTTGSFYGCKEPDSSVEEENNVNIAVNKGKENKATSSRGGTDDQEVVAGQFSHVIHHDEQHETKPSQILDTCQIEIPRNQYSLPVSPVILPPSECCDPSSSGDQVSASPVNERGGTRNSSSSNASPITEGRLAPNEESAHVKVETGDGETDKLVLDNFNKDLNCLKSSNNTVLISDAVLDEHVGKIDESKVDHNARKESIEDYDSKRIALSLDACSELNVSTSRKTNDSFSEKIMDVFGSNSFLLSDSSMEVTLPSISETLELPLPKTSQDNSGDSSVNKKTSKKLDNFSETLMNIFGSDSFIEGDDMETSKVAAVSLTFSKHISADTAASPKGLPGITKMDCSVDHEIKAGCILENILEPYDTDSLTGADVKSSSQTSPTSASVTGEPMIQSEDAMFENLRSSPAKKGISKAKSDGLDPTSAATRVVDFRSSGILHRQGKSSLCQSDEHNTDATIKLLTKKKLEDEIRRDAYMAKSTGKHFETANEKPETEMENVEKLKFENQLKNHLTEISPSISLKEELDETPCQSEPNKQADVDTITGVSTAPTLTSDISIPDNVHVHVKSMLKTDLTDAVPSLVDNEDGEVNDSNNEGSHMERVHEADISIDPSGYDFLSCSASPVHGNLLTDSDNSGQSDQEYQADDQVFSGQLADHLVDDKQSENCDLSEGEIPSSDSETSTNVIIKKEGHQTADRKSNRSSRSRREDKQSSSHKVTDRSRDRTRRTAVGDNRSKFFEQKRRILEERQQALKNPRRHSESKYGTSKDGERGSHSSIRRRLPSRESPEKRRVKKTTVETRTRQEDRRDEKRRDTLDDVARSRGSHSSSHPSSRRQVSHDRPGSKGDRRTTQSAEDSKRTRNSRTNRR
ncbi:uncharacterized protein [Asterias amurensis]|uniref:uncharacterized protein n=1 Tax=Asterias amurensis TaxID=7602 RepID=UPI003AB4BD61